MKKLISNSKTLNCKAGRNIGHQQAKENHAIIKHTSPVVAESLIKMANSVNMTIFQIQ